MKHLCKSVVTVAVLLAGQATLAADNYALLVGVTKYGSSSGLRTLTYTAGDVEEPSGTLQKAGFQARNVTLMTQKRGGEDPRFLPTKSNVVNELRNLLKIVDPGDTVIVAFSGHGVKFKEQPTSYFCPMDARIGDKANLLSLDDVYAELAKSKARKRLLLCDACRNDPFADNSLAGDSVTRPEPVKPPGGIAALFSCSAGQRAFEDTKLKSGVFFHFINEGLSGAADIDKDKKISLLELHVYTRTQVKQRTLSQFGKVQLPDFRGDLNEITLTVGDFVNSTNIQLPKGLTNSIGMKFTLIPAGEFLMGTREPDGDDAQDQTPQRMVKLSQPYLLGVHEVTQRQFKEIMSKNPSYFPRKKGDTKLGDHPVENVTWSEAVEFCRALSSRQQELHRGHHYRLPTEAEWEFAASHQPSRISATAWHISNSSYSTHPVGTLVPNKFGIYDMSGNVSEWCNDWYSPDYYKIGASNDPRGPEAPGPKRLKVQRGGSFIASERLCGTRYRHAIAADEASNRSGFRVILIVSDAK